MNSTPIVAVPSAVFGPSYGWTNVRPSCGFDLTYPLEGHVHALDQLHGRAQLAADLHPEGVRGLRHHDGGGGAELPCAPGQ
ncbi:MAG: hypothetical protein U5K74_12130 [Gemmatimonadaceae bacterium]|nr:hypothetical protein [Gemmatimonadaceae bacterium]